MIKPCYLLLCLFMLFACKNNQYHKITESHPHPDYSNQPLSQQQQDSLASLNESMVVHDSLIDLIATKSLTEVKNVGQIHLKYKLKDWAAYREISFNYFMFSDVIFPNTSVAIIQGNHLTKSNYYLFHDNKLMLPILGMKFMIIYIVDLEKNQVVETYERRTYLPLVWINSSNETFLVSDPNKVRKALPIAEYNVFVCNLKKGKFYQVQQGHIKFKWEEREDDTLTWNQVKRILIN